MRENEEIKDTVEKETQKILKPCVRGDSICQIFLLVVVPRKIFLSSFIRKKKNN